MPLGVVTFKLLSFVEENLDVYTQERNGMTPLHVAAFHGKSISR